jgi:PadR family transcriptional regulator PadR
MILCIEFLSMARTAADPSLLPGTLDLLILKTLSHGPLHGYGIAQQIKLASDEVLQVEEGSLYPALQRLELKGWIESEWQLTPHNRRARYYRLSAAGLRRLVSAEAEYGRLADAVRRVLLWSH